MDHILIGRSRHSNVLDVRSFRAADYDADRCLVVAKVRERLAVSEQTTHRFHVETDSISRNKRRYRVKSSIMLKSQIGSQLWKT
jgi:hypothetical protein